MSIVKAKAPYFETTVSTDVDVEIDPDELHDEGWHHETECAGAAIPPVGGSERTVLARAIISLHRQAHPSQRSDPFFCHEEPCRSLAYDQVRETP